MNKYRLLCLFALTNIHTAVEIVIIKDRGVECKVVVYVEKELTACI